MHRRSVEHFASMQHNAWFVWFTYLKHIHKMYGNQRGHDAWGRKPDGHDQDPQPATRGHPRAFWVHAPNHWSSARCQREVNPSVGSAHVDERATVQSSSLPAPSSCQGLHVCVCCTYLCVYTFIFMCVCTHAHVNECVYVCVYMYTYKHTDVCMHVCMYACMYLCTHAYANLSVHLHVCVCVCVCIHTHTYTQTWHTYVHTYISYIHAYICTYIHTCVYTYIQTCMNTFKHA